MEESLSTSRFILNILIAMAAGICIGIEREVKDKNAGLKTITLVAVGAAIFVGLSYQLVDMPNVDIGRIISQVIVGIGFLGAGVILQHKEKVTGLSTAAAIWCSAGLGCLSALNMYAELAASTVLIVFINVAMGYYDRFLRGKVKENGDQKDE